MSWKPEVVADNTGNWCSNGLTFEHKEEAEAYVHALSWNWTAVRKTRVINADVAATHRWDGSRAEAIE